MKIQFDASLKDCGCLKYPFHKIKWLCVIQISLGMRELWLDKKLYGLSKLYYYLYGLSKLNNFHYGFEIFSLLVYYNHCVK
jgi:hypothetical protein